MESDTQPVLLMMTEYLDLFLINSGIEIWWLFQDHTWPKVIHDKHFITLKKKSHLLTAELQGTTSEATSEEGIREQIQIFSITIWPDSPPPPLIHSNRS